VGAFDPIRKLFADTPAARQRGYTAGTFSFNSGDGRCPTCSGNGFEHVEMQFLSDVYLRCPDCDGKRYRPEVLEITLQGCHMAAVLDMTVAEAMTFFGDRPEVTARLRPLADVGLEYVRLGQPVPTLSGGEAQRLKLAGHLADAARGRVEPTLFLFDEPTTGLHFDDTARLLRAFRQLIGSGHSLIVIEHNLDVIRAADWIIDLGPEGGEAGGLLVAAGTPAQVRDAPGSHTGAALRAYDAALDPGRPAIVAEPPAAWTVVAPTRPPRAIQVRRAREHNLKNFDVEIPHNRFTVITGVSGSGKSTLAFDILFAEGQRRYLESLNAYARQFVQPATRPDVDAVFGIPPTVAIEQRTSRGGRKSTVATLTEIYHFLRLLYVKLGVQHCPDDGTRIEPQSADAIVARILREHRGRHIGLLAPLVVARKGFYTDLAKWARDRGHTHLRVDGEFLPTRPWPRLDRFREHTIELPVADLVVTPDAEPALRAALGTALEHGKGVVYLLSPLDGLLEGRATPVQETFSVRRACPTCSRNFEELDPRLFSFNSRHGWCPACFGTGLKLPGFESEHTGEEAWWGDTPEGELQVCARCNGERLNPVARHVRFRGESIAAVTARSVADAEALFRELGLSGRDAEVARDLLAELQSRLSFLRDVGLGYLSLDRSAPTLSGGEAQRTRLAAQLGSNLQGVCYILDEPTIGLHPRDNRKLLDTLDRLEAKGNTLVVVEHDEDTIRRADHVLDLGPGAGTRGGFVVAQGTADELVRTAGSVTGRFLAHPLLHPLAPRRRIDPPGPRIEIRQATRHNLKGVDVDIPLGGLTVITGVSGSGKSTLARNVLHDNLHRFLQGDTSVQGCAEMRGREHVGRLLEVDQTPIGKTPRSCPATYVGFWDAIRRIFADTTEARMRGYGPERFSYNTGGGRCPACEGQGLRTIEMSFLPDVKVLCDACGGKRFNPETLGVTWRDKSIGDILSMSVDDAVDFFAAHAATSHALRLLQDVGLGYLTLGQQSPTLSGGEAQRIKLVTELAKVRARPPGRGAAHAAGKHTLYVLDEPTVGLHMADVEKLVLVLHRLVDAGNTVVVIEHNLDVMAEADWLIDLGPEGGQGGGEVVAQGSPEQIVTDRSRSHTAQALGEFLDTRTRH
jgi:excinuclease ABC subunit A